MSFSTWYNGQWSNRQIIEIDSVSETLENFVFLINEFGLDRPGLSNDLFDKARIDGRDILVCGEDGVTKLPHELVSYDPANRKIELYVKLPALSATDKTIIFVYYGNASHIEPPSIQMWSDYQYVTHNGGLTNATTRGLGQAFGSGSIQPGLHGESYYGEKSGDIIDTGLYRLNFPLTFQAIVKPTSNNPSTVLGMWRSSDQDFHVYQDTNGWAVLFDNAGGINAFGEVRVNEWNHLAATVEGIYFNTYQDGQLANQIPSNLSASFVETGASLKINDMGNFNSSDGGYYYDEIRIRNSVLSEAYLAVEYQNVTDPSSLYIVTPEEFAAGVYMYVDTSIVTDQWFEPSFSRGTVIFMDSVSYLPFEALGGVVGTGVAIDITGVTHPINGMHFTVNAQEQSLGLNVSFGNKNMWGGATRFKPSRPFELFKENDHEKNKDSRFLSGVISEIIQMGGVVCYVWLLEGTFGQNDDQGKPMTQIAEGYGETDEDDIMSLFGIQDAVLGENRDRSYSKDAYRIKGTYAVSQNELDFARFGIMMNNDIIQLEMHKEDMERICGRRLIPGDVIEMPHLREVGMQKTVVNKYYQVDNVTKAPSGYDHTYNYHILALTLRPVVDAHEFLDIMSRTDEYDNTIGSQLGTRDVNDAITEKIQTAAAEQASTTGWDTSPLYIDDEDNVFSHRWSEDGQPPNGKPVSMVTSFPRNPTDGEYVCRVDHFPNRLYRYQQGRWILKEVDQKRDWQPYNWTRKLRDFATDRSLEDDMRPWEYKSVHDILTPRQGRSNPSPKGHDIKHVDIFDFDKKLNVTIPEVAVADTVVRKATLHPQSGPTIISDFLNAVSGEYTYFMIYYVLKQGNNQQTGEIMISDDGSNTSMDHEWTTIGAMPITLTVDHHQGFRKLRYTLAGTQSVEMQYYIEAKWNFNDD